MDHNGFERQTQHFPVEGDRGAGAREDRGREKAGNGRTGGGKRDLYEGGKRSRNKVGDSLLFTTGYYSVKNTHLTKF